MKISTRIFLIIVALLALATGIYFKFINTYIEGVQITTEQNLNNQTDLNLREAILFIKQVEPNYLESPQNSVNATILKKLQILNSISIIIMTTAIVLLLKLLSRKIQLSESYKSN